MTSIVPSLATALIRKLASFPEPPTIEIVAPEVYPFPPFVRLNRTAEVSVVFSTEPFAEEPVI